MRIKVTAVYVDDQEKALGFYTGVLGFVEKTEIPWGQG
jgi:catechol 2,3-dioxygenase-like lactoylglutathione lyase family enzyme